MESWLIENFTFQNVMLVCIALYFIFPKLKSWILHEKKGEDTDEDHGKRITILESKVTEIESKLGRDFYELIEIKKETKDSLEEREILMRATLAIIRGIREIGANGSTKQAQEEIEQYLNRKAHSN